MKLQHQYFLEIPRLNETVELDEGFASEIRNYEDVNIRETDRIIDYRKGSVDCAIEDRIPKTYEEAEIQGI